MPKQISAHFSDIQFYQSQLSDALERFREGFLEPLSRVMNARMVGAKLKKDAAHETFLELTGKSLTVHVVTRGAGDEGIELVPNAPEIKRLGLRHTVSLRLWAPGHYHYVGKTMGIITGPASYEEVARFTRADLLKIYPYGPDALRKHLKP